MKYLLLLGGTEGEEQDNIPPEQMAAIMEPWNRYGQEVAESGVFLAGEGLRPSATATTVWHRAGGERIVTDGPFAETKEQIGGFYLLECKDLDEALDWAKKVPVGEGSAVEVRPVMDYTGTGYEDPNAATQVAG